MNKVEIRLPTEENYPLDSICNNILRSLEKKNWAVEGLKVEFQEFKNNGFTYKCVKKISGENFELEFSRLEKSKILNKIEEANSIGHIIIPNKDLTFYPDGSGPTYVEKEEKNTKMTLYRGNSCASNKLAEKFKELNKLDNTIGCEKVYEVFSTFLIESVLKKIENAT